MAITVERDERWGQLGAGLGALLSGIIEGADRKRISRGVAQIDQDPSIQGSDKFATVLKQYGPEGADMYSQLEQARVHQERLRAAQEERQSEDVAWPAMLQGAPGPIGSTPAGAALGVPRTGAPTPLQQPVVQPAAQPVAQPTTRPTVQPAVATGPMLSPKLASANVDWQDETPDFKQRFSQALQAMPPELRDQVHVESGKRTTEHQAEIYARSKQGRAFMAAPPGRSEHERGGAADLTFDSPKAEQAFRKAVSGTGLEFPFPDRDPNHLQLATGRGGSQARRDDGAAGGFNKTTVRADDLANDTMEGISALQYGQMRRQQLAQAIEKANPDAPAHVKMMAFERASKMLAPEERMEWEIEKAKLNFDAKLAVSQMQTEREREKAERPQFFTTREGKLITVNPKTGEAMETQAPEGSTPVGRGAGGAGAMDRLSPAQTEFWAKYLNQVGSLPIAIGRNKAAATQILAKAADLGGDPGRMIESIGEVKADTHSLMAATRLADAATSYEATALKNLDIATKELGGDPATGKPGAAPTNFGPWLNRWIETGETQIGNTKVPPSVTAVLTFANEYAKVMSGSTGAQGATVDARREAAELFSPYFSKGQWDQVARIARQDMANRKASLYERVDAIKERLHSVGSGRSTMESEGAPQPQTAPTGAVQQPQQPAGGWPTPNASQVDLLHKNDSPELRRWFDHKFGPGAAERVLK